MARRQQRPGLNGFFDAKAAASTACSSSWNYRIRKRKGSAFGDCPLCQCKFPWHALARHAANCDGTPSSGQQQYQKPKAVMQEEYRAGTAHATGHLGLSTSTTNSAKEPRFHDVDFERVCHPQTPAKAILKPYPEQPIPGLLVFEEFVTEAEERQILAELDGMDPKFEKLEYLPWRVSSFNGRHNGKRWGVHCNLRTRQVTPAEHELPNFIRSIVSPKLQQLSIKEPNEANAIDYRRNQGHYLKNHVDDRRMSKEPIANLSLAGDCFMTFLQESRTNSSGQQQPLQQTRVLLKRRCLQVLTGKARYDYSHGIQHEDLLSDRRVSVTMRESPLTTIPEASSRTTEITSGQLTLTALFPTNGIKPPEQHKIKNPYNP